MRLRSPSSAGPRSPARYIGPLRRHSKATIVYYGHDLHFQRMGMQAQRTGDAQVAIDAAVMEGIERSVWGEVDVVLYPSPEETAVARPCRRGRRPSSHTRMTRSAMAGATGEQSRDPVCRGVRPPSECGCRGMAGERDHDTDLGAGPRCDAVIGRRKSNAGGARARGRPSGGQRAG